MSETGDFFSGKNKIKLRLFTCNSSDNTDNKNDAPDRCFAYILSETKGADQLRGNREAGQRLCFKYKLFLSINFIYFTSITQKAH